jgi:hypothetical protein
MVELKSKNLFLRGNEIGSIYTISKIIDFLDLIGLNVLYLFSIDNDKKTMPRLNTLGGLLKCNKKIFTPSTFEDVLKDNLFRVDILIVDGNINVEDNYKDLRKISKIPVIYIKSESYIGTGVERKLKLKYFDTAYLFSRLRDSSVLSTTGLGGIQWIGKDNLEEYVVEELKDEWKSNLKELKVQYIRDKNLRDLLGDVD